MTRLKIKKLSEDAVIPRYAKQGDAGMDLFSIEGEVIKSNERKTIRTGISMEIPEGMVGLVWDKSGIASKKGIKTMAGVVDSGYRGEIQVVLHNLSTEDFVIEKNSKVAQMLIQQVHQLDIKEVNDLSESERRKDGFGSTGL